MASPYRETKLWNTALKKYREGKSFYEIGKELGKDPKTIYRWIGYAKGWVKETRWTPERRGQEIEKVRGLRETGMTFKQIIRTTKLSPNTVRRRMKGK